MKTMNWMMRTGTGGMRMTTKCPGSFERMASVQLRRRQGGIYFWEANSVGEGPGVDKAN